MAHLSIRYNYLLDCFSSSFILFSSSILFRFKYNPRSPGIFSRLRLKYFDSTNMLRIGRIVNPLKIKNSSSLFQLSLSQIKMANIRRAKLQMMVKITTPGFLASVSCVSIFYLLSIYR